VTFRIGYRLPNGGKHVTDTEFWPWFTGFWEGEGSVVVHWKTTSSGHPSGSIGISIVQKNRAPLDYIVEQTGMGTVTMNVSPRTARVAPGRVVHVWQVSGRKRVAWFLQHMMRRAIFRDNLLKEAWEAVQRFESERGYHRKGEVSE
jgi:hypothetical protein